MKAKAHTDKPAGERWHTFYRLGREMAKQMPVHCSLEQIARQCGFPGRQHAWVACTVALGKLTFRLRREIKEARR